MNYGLYLYFLLAAAYAEAALESIFQRNWRGTSRSALVAILYICIAFFVMHPEVVDLGVAVYRRPPPFTVRV
jgi:hypothetical protein